MGIFATKLHIHIDIEELREKGPLFLSVHQTLENLKI